MGTILNTCKDARNKIRAVEKSIDDAVVAWKVLSDGNKEVVVYLIDKSKEIRDEVLALKGIIEAIDIELEKDSQVRSYYNMVYNKCDNFLISTKEK